MTVRERVLALKLMEKQSKNPSLAKSTGVEIKMKNKKENEK